MKRLVIPFLNLSLLIFLVQRTALAQQSSNTNPLDLPDPRPGPELLTGGGAGDFLLFPYYTVAGQVNYFSVMNTSNTWYQMRVFVRRASDGIATVSFPVILPPNNVFTFRVEEETGGHAAMVTVTGDSFLTLFNHEVFVQALDGLVPGVSFDESRNATTAFIRSSVFFGGSETGYVEVSGEAIFGSLQGGIFRPLIRNEPLPEGGFFPGPRGTSTFTWAAVRGGLDRNPATQDLGDAPNALVGTAYLVRPMPGTWDRYNALAIRDFRVTRGNHLTENYPPDDAVVLVDERCSPGTTGGFNGSAFCSVEGAIVAIGAELNQGDGGVAEINNLFYRALASHFLNGELTGSTQAVVLFPTRRFVTPFDNQPRVEAFDNDRNRVALIPELPRTVLSKALSVLPIKDLAQLPPSIQGGWLRIGFHGPGTTAIALTLNTISDSASQFIGYWPVRQGSEETPLPSTRSGSGPRLVAAGGSGDFLLFPYYTVLNQVNYFKLVNTSATWYQVRVSLRRASDASAVLDFPVILPVNGSFTFQVEEDTQAPGEAMVRVTKDQLPTLFNHEVFIQARDGSVPGISFEGLLGPPQAAFIRRPTSATGSGTGYVEVVGEAVFGSTQGSTFRPLQEPEPLPEGGMFPGPRGTSTFNWAAVRGGLDGKPSTQDLADGPNDLMGVAYLARTEAGVVSWGGFTALAIRDFRVTGGYHPTEN